MQETGFLDRATAKMQYAVYVPRGVEVVGLPAILFLHGSGECGQDGLKQTAIGLPQSIRLSSSRWPFLVVIPQKPVMRSLWSDWRAELNGVLEAVMAEFRPDPKRLYLTGLSQGGYGAFALADRLTWKFAAVAPVCGGADLAQCLATFKDIPVWAFHGDQDGAVNHRSAQRAIRALKKAGEEARFSLYKGVGHNSWDKAYGESKLPQWLLEHKLVTYPSKKQ